VYHAGELVISTQVFGGGHLGVWEREVSRELDSDVDQPRKGNKDKEIFYLLRYYILSVVILFWR